ncbi:Holliday junction resolvase RuvX [Coxiella burnetii]|uniref:Holliday junction resolvase RuvX n=1 Tax=Coxiella burnetii TaxID=777 RepID=UPI002176660D|nr:Holliday junction resolvase RuvX [Coxiella burnetii]
MPNQNLIALGFDFGMKRIGVAVGQTVTHSANAIAILKAQDGVPDWEKIKMLIETWHSNVLVVGIPYNMDGSEQTLTFAARKFARKLQTRFGLPLSMVDERLTTIEAKRQWYEQGLTKRPQHLDNYAAKLILEQWLQEQKNE